MVLLRLSIDIADPGRGLGLGLGGPSDPDSVASDSDATGTGGKSLEVLSVLVVIGDGPNLSSFLIAIGRFSLMESSTLGFRPLASTFFRALMPMQSTSCLMASRSETARRIGVRPIVLVRGRV